MAFETSRTFISGLNFGLFLYSDAVARMLGWFLHLTITLRVGLSLFSAKESQFS